MTVAALLGERDHVLLDFDGPVCALFSGDTSDHEVAERLRPMLGSPLPAEIERTGDPFDILAYARTYGPATAHAVELQLGRLETIAALTAPETPGAHEALRVLGQGGYTVTIVSNNAADMIRSYLNMHELATTVRRISARNRPDTRLKPDPFLVEQAIESLGTDASHCVLVGDSIDDIEAGTAAGVPVIAYATDPEQEKMFEDRGADAVITSMAELRI